MYEDANVVTTGLTDEEVEQLKERLDPKSHPTPSKKRVSSSSVTSEVASSTASSAPTESMSVSAQLQPYLSVSYYCQLMLVGDVYCTVTPWY